MLSPLSILLLSLSGNDPVAPSSSLSDSGASAPTVESPLPQTPLAETHSLGRRADPAKQMVYSSLGGGLGIVAGGFVGGAIAAGLSSDSEGWSAIGNVIFGVALGALAGGTTGATMGAVAARPPQKDRSFGATTLGGFGGLFLGFLAGSATYGALDADGTASSALCFVAIPALAAGAGATLVDQWTTPGRITGARATPSLALSPWMPREGFVGLRLSLPARI